MAKPPAKKPSALGAKGKKTTSTAAKKAAAALKSASSAKAAPVTTRKKPGPKPGSKRGATTATGAPRKKPGPKPGSKRGTLTAAGKPRQKPGPKPAVKKVAAKKTVAKKTVAKKPAAKKTVPTKVQKKPVVVKVAAQKKPAPKPTASTRPATTSEQIATLRTRIDNIQARLKRADAQTQKSITTLEKAFGTLQTKAGTNSPELTEQVALLSQKIENITASAHTDVGAAFNDALSNPSSDNLTEALTRAEQRLVAAETAQSASIAKVNRHIADMALAIDARFKKEARINAEAISDLGHRITTVEAESAAAISQLGEKVVAISSEFGQRAEDSEAVIKEKVSEIALKTQEEFEQYRANLERRIDVLASEQNQARSNLDNAMEGLASRVEGLEHVASSAAMTALSAANPPAYPSAITSDESLAPTAEDFDAFAPEPLAHTSTQIVPPNPYAVPEPEPIVNEAEAHIPQEFNPETFIQGSFGRDQIPAPSSLQAPTPMPNPAMSTSALTTEDLGTPATTGAYYETPAPNAAPLPELSMPYADPAYAETPASYEQAMDQARPGAFKSDKARFTLPSLNLTPQNMKVAGLALGVAFVGLISAKVLLGKPDSNTIVADNSITRNLETSSGGLLPVTEPRDNEPVIFETTAPTIGDYEDNKINEVPAGSQQALTLEAAADAGDAIAQYQLGLSYLENGRIEDAVNLIRSASNNGQPAAQYRLAKLYETGEGVAQNAGMARQLTERAARSGNRIAMHDLALYHAEGRGGVKMDLDTAAKWFEKAAERGVVDSQFNLGVMYETGKGVPKSLTDAFVWYSIAAAQGDQFAKERVGVLETQLDDTLVASASNRAQKFTPSKIDQAANGIFNDLPWNSQKKAATTTRTADPRVKDVQVMLIGLGFDTGGADGAIGPKTRTAIVDFQKANGLPETGQVDDALIDRLEFASGA